MNGDDAVTILEKANRGSLLKKNKVGVCFYEEKSSKDLLFVWRDRDRASRWNGQGCSTAILKNPSSVHWGEVDNTYLYLKCRRLNLQQVKERIQADPRWTLLVIRAAWMSTEMTTKGEAVLPY